MNEIGEIIGVAAANETEIGTEIAGTGIEIEAVIAIGSVSMNVSESENVSGSGIARESVTAKGKGSGRGREIARETIVEWRSRLKTNLLAVPTPTHCLPTR